MRDDTPQLNRVAFYYDQGSSKRRLLLALCECLLEQTPEAVLLPLNPEKILNLLPRTRARNLNVQKRASHNLVALQPARSRKTLKVSNMLVGQPDGESMFQFPHSLEHRHRDRAV